MPVYHGPYSEDRLTTSAVGSTALLLLMSSSTSSCRLLCRRYSSSRTSSRVVAPRASALLLLMHVNITCRRRIYDVVLHALSSFIYHISAGQHRPSAAGRSEHHRRRASARVVLHHHQIIVSRARAKLLNPLLHPAAWPTYFCAKNVFFN